MPRGTFFWLGLVSFLPALACSGGDGALIELPSVPTSHALFGTASAGGGVPASDVRVFPAGAETALPPSTITGTDIDVVFLGIEESDFPTRVKLAEARIVQGNNVLARPLPAIYEPHVLEAPSPYDAPDALVPVAVSSEPGSSISERQSRLEKMLSGFAIENDCRDPDTDFTFHTPRIPAEVVSGFRTLSNGNTIIAFSTSSLLLIGVLEPGGMMPEIVELEPELLEPIMQGEGLDFNDLGDGEATVDGRLLPDAMTFDRKDGFGATAVRLVYDATRGYIEGTPVTDMGAPRNLYGSRKITLDGIEQHCAFGLEQGSDRAGGIWCQAPTATATSGWSQVGTFPRSFGIWRVGMHQGRALAVDVAGTMYEHVGGESWNPLFSVAINDGCDALCASFLGTQFLEGGTNRVLALAGTVSQFLFIDDSTGSLRPVIPDAVGDALYADERADAEFPRRFSAITEDPQGALWIGTLEGNLFRLSADNETLERICVPTEISGAKIASLEAHPDGRLLIGMSPATLAYSTWR